MLTILRDIDPTLTSALLKGLTGLENLNRLPPPFPILIRFLGAFEVSLVHSNRGSLSFSTISTRLDMI